MLWTYDNPSKNAPLQPTASPSTPPPTASTEQNPVTPLPRSNDTPGLANAAPAWDGQFFDKAKLDAATKAQGPGADGRTVLNDQGWMSALNPLSGITTKTPAVAASGGFWGNNGAQGDYTMGGAQGAVYQDKLGRSYNDAGKDAQGNQLIQYRDNSGAGFEAPGGNGRDRVQPTYKLDANGNATPVSAGTSYAPSG